MTNLHRTAAQALTAVSVLALAPIASAYDYETCGGYPVIWDDPFSMIQNGNSIPIGSARAEAMVAGINRWRNVGAMQNMVSLYPVVGNATSIYHNDGDNDVAVVDRDDIEGRNGLTILQHDGCFLPGDKEWTEADVMVAHDSSWSNPLEAALTSNSARSTFVHEFGHAHGFLHFQGYNMMRSHQPRPLIGGPGEHVDVLPSDAAGGRYLYPQSGSERNLFASAHRRDNTSDVIATNTGQGPVFSCSGGGGTLTINSTVGNNGTLNVTQTERWYVSTSSTQYGGTPIYTWNNSTFNKNTAHTRLVSFTMPALSVGTYYLFHKVDTFDVADEANENDNVARELLKIEVISC